MSLTTLLVLRAISTGGIASCPGAVPIARQAVADGLATRSRSPRPDWPSCSRTTRSRSPGAWVGRRPGGRLEADTSGREVPVLVTREQVASGRSPIGLPVGAFTVRNSERVTAACPKRWWFRVAEGLAPKEEYRALAYGTAWHATLEDVHRTWMRVAGAAYEIEDLWSCPWCGRHRLSDPEKCPRCRGTRLGPVARAAAEWRGTDREEDADALSRAAEGWLTHHGTRPPEGLQVVAVELGLSMPVRSSMSTGGAVYAPELYVVRSPDGRERLARTGEAIPGRLPAVHEVELRRCPAHLSSRLDVVWLDGRSLWVGELKTSQDPGRYLSGLSVDPQVTTYELVLQHASDRGHLGQPSEDCRGFLASGLRVAGWWYDVSSSRLQRDPYILQGRAKKDGTRVGGGGISTSRTKLASVPSWRLRACLDGAEIDAEGRRRGLLPEEAEVLLSEQEATVDRKLYLRESGASGAEKVEEVRLEILGEARRSAAMHRAAARAEDVADVAEAFPRVPICRGAGGSCPYRGPCFNDSPESRDRFDLPRDQRDLPGRAPVVAASWYDDDDQEEREPEGVGAEDWG